MVIYFSLCGLNVSRFVQLRKGSAVILAGDYSFRGQRVTTNGIRMEHCLCHVLIPDFRRRAICGFTRTLLCCSQCVTLWVCSVSRTS